MNPENKVRIETTNNNDTRLNNNNRPVEEYECAIAARRNLRCQRMHPIFPTCQACAVGAALADQASLMAARRPEAA